MNTARAFHPKVSIIIPVYNGADYLRDAIDSALHQTYDNCEVIVINDGSNDGGATEAVALSYGERIRYYEKPNGGVATALNLGIEKMEGEYFSWLSHDDFYLPRKVQHQIKFLRGKAPDTILYGGFSLLSADTGYREDIRFFPMFSKKQLNTPLFPVFHGLACGCTVLIHRSHFDRVGLFDPAKKTTQDYDMWFRMFRNAKVRYHNTCDAVLRQHAAQGSKTIGGHVEEGNALWIRMGQQTSDCEKAEIAGTSERFYRDVYSRIRGAYPRAAAWYLSHIQPGQIDVAPQKTLWRRFLVAISVLGWRGSVKKAFSRVRDRILGKASGRV